MVDVKVSMQAVAARRLVAVRRKVTIPEVATSWRPALERVWEFVRKHPGVWTNGQTIFHYRHGVSRDAPMEIDFGVEVTRSIKPEGEVYATETPAGQVVTAVHVGRYACLGQTHEAIQAWCSANKCTIAGQSWEIYGDWTDDETKLKTVVCYLLR